MSLNINADKQKISSENLRLTGSTDFAIRSGTGTDEKDCVRTTIDPVSKLPRVGINRSGDAVEKVTVLTAGANYVPAQTVVNFSVPPSGGTTATGTAVIISGQVVNVQITNKGSGYTSAPSVTITDLSGSGQGATADCSLNAIEFELDISGAIRTSTSIISDTARILNLDIDNFVSPKIQFRAPALKIYANNTLTQWQGGEPVVIDDLRYNGDNVYVVTQSGTTGGSPPLHIDGSVTDGTAVLRHAGFRVSDVAADYYNETVWPESVTPPFGDQTAKVATTEFVYRLATNDVGGRVYVSQQIGDDANDGRSAAKPVRSIKRAAQIAAGTPDKESLIIAGGDYLEDNPISIPPDCSVVGDNLRLVIVRPENPGKHMFKIADKNYIIGLTFKDKLDGSGQPDETWGFAVVFDDKQRLYYDPSIGGNQIERKFPIGLQILGPNRQRLYFNNHSGNASTLLAGLILTRQIGVGTSEILDVVFTPAGQVTDGYVDTLALTGGISSGDTLEYTFGGTVYEIDVEDIDSIRAEGEVVRHESDTSKTFTINNIDGSRQSEFDGGVVFTCAVEPDSHEFKFGQKVFLSGLPNSDSLEVFNGYQDIYEVEEDADGRARTFVLRAGKSHPYTASTYSGSLTGANVKANSPYILVSLLNSPFKISASPLAFGQLSYDVDNLIQNNKVAIADEAVERTKALFPELEIPLTTITGVLSVNSAVITGVSDTSGVSIGQLITSSTVGFPTGATITAFTSNTITMSLNATQDNAFTGTVPGDVKCKRDTRYMLEALARDLKHGGNYHSIEAANLYVSGSQTQHVGSQISETVYAFEQAKELAVRAIRNRLIYFAGATWTPQVFGTANNIQEIAYNGELFVAVGDGGAIATSPDGITWTQRNASQTITGNNLEDVIWNGSHWIAVGFNGTIITSLNAISWSLVTSGTTQSLRAVTWDGNQAVVVGANGTILKSSDLSTWSTATTVPLTNQFDDVVYRQLGASSGQFITVGQTGAVMTSTDGDTWTAVTVPTSNNLEAVSFDEDKIVAVGLNGAIINSEDGVTWQVATQVPNSLSLHEVKHDGNRFWALGTTGNLMYSTDGAVWTAISSGTGNTLTAVVSNYTTLLIAGSGGFIATSTDTASELIYSNLGVYQNLQLTTYQGSPAVGSNADFSCANAAAAMDTLQELYLNIVTNNADGRYVDAARFIGINQTFIEEEALEYAKATVGFVLSAEDETKCKRDIGYILSALRRDLVLGGNRGTVTAGEAYFTAGQLTGIPQSELAGTRAAFTRAYELAILAMRNWITGDGSSGNPTYVPVYSSTPLVFDYSVTVDTSLPVCDNVRSAIEAFALILDNILTQSQAYTITDGTTFVENPTYPEGSYLDGNGNRFTVDSVADDLPTIEASPYIQNSSIISKIGGSGVEIDGAKVKTPNVPFPGVESNGKATFPAQGKSMVANAFTIVSEGGTGYLIKNDGYTQLVSVFCIFTQDGVLAESGGYASITNSASNFGTYALRATGYRAEAYSFDIGTIQNVNQTATGRTIFTIQGLGREPLEHFIVKIEQGGIAYENVQDNIEYTIEQVTPLTTSAPFRAECELSAAMVIENPNTGSPVPVGANLIGATVKLHRPSIVNSSSHTWEFVGSGNDYNALPENGGVKVEANEQVSQSYGRVYTSGTDEVGDFKVGYFAEIENRTGNITFAGSVTISEVEFLKLKGGSVVVTGFSADNTLGGSFASDSLIPTQKAVKDYIGNNLGQFLNKQYSTNAIPRALVELTDSGKISIDQIPALRPFTVYSVKNQSGRLAIEGALAGDIAVQENTEVINVLPTDIDTTTDYINKTAHGYSTGFKAIWSEGSSQAIPAIDGTTYYLYVVDQDNFRLAATETDANNGTSLVDFTSQGTGTHTLEVTTGSTSFILNSDLSSQYFGTDATVSYDFPVGNIITGSLSGAQGEITAYTEGIVYQINVTDGGAGYTAVPSVQITGGGSPSVTATAEAAIAGGQVTTITITNPGLGYTSAPNVQIAAAPAGGADASGQAFIESRLAIDIVNSKKFEETDTVEDFDTSAGVIKNFNINNVGSNYAANTYTNVATTTNGLGSDATLNITTDISGNVTTVVLNNRGTGYAASDTLSVASGVLNNNSQTGPAATVNIGNSGTGLVDGTFTGVQLLTNGNGTGIVATVEIAGNAVANVTVTGGGQNYTIGDSLFIPGGSGPDANGTQSSVTLTVGSVTLGSGFQISVTTLRGEVVDLARVVNTSASLSENWVSLSSSTVNASDLIGGPVSTSVLANNSGAANSQTFLRGDQAYAPVVQSIKKVEPRFYERTNAAAAYTPIPSTFLTFDETTTIEPGYVISGTGIVSSVPGQVISLFATNQAEGVPNIAGTGYQTGVFATSSTGGGTKLTVNIAVSSGTVTSAIPYLPGENYNVGDTIYLDTPQGVWFAKGTWNANDRIYYNTSRYDALTTGDDFDVTGVTLWTANASFTQDELVYYDFNVYKAAVAVADSGAVPPTHISGTSSDLTFIKPLSVPPQHTQGNSIPMRVVADPVTNGSYTVGETVTGQTSGITANVISWDSTNYVLVCNQFQNSGGTALTGTNAKFLAGEQVNGVAGQWVAADQTVWEIVGFLASTTVQQTISGGTTVQSLVTANGQTTVNLSQPVINPGVIDGQTITFTRPESPIVLDAPFIGTGFIDQVIIIDAGGGYTNGTYNDVPLSGGAGSNLRANITIGGIAGSSGEVTSVLVTNAGSGYASDFQIAAIPNEIGSGNGNIVLEAKVATIAKQLANVTIDVARVNDDTLSSDPFGKVGVARFAKSNFGVLPRRGQFIFGDNGAISIDQGVNSGLDADQLDGQEGAYYLQAGNMVIGFAAGQENQAGFNNGFIPTNILNGLYNNASIGGNAATATSLNVITNNPSGYFAPSATNEGIEGQLFDNDNTSIDPLDDGGTTHGVVTFRFEGNGADAGRVHQLGFGDNGNLWYRRSSSTSSWNTWYKFWHQNNDGEGSGLDADRLDSKDSTYFENPLNLRNTRWQTTTFVEREYLSDTIIPEFQTEKTFDTAVNVNYAPVAYYDIYIPGLDLTAASPVNYAGTFFVTNPVALLDVASQNVGDVTIENVRVETNTSDPSQTYTILTVSIISGGFVKTDNQTGLPIPAKRIGTISPNVNVPFTNYTPSKQGSVTAFSADVTGGNAKLKIGRSDNVSTNPVIDYHSSGALNTYDVRLEASGGGGGSLWSSGTTYSTGTFIYYGANLYEVTTGGDSGTAPPIHTAGSVTASGGTAIYAYSSPVVDGDGVINFIAKEVQIGNSKIWNEGNIQFVSGIDTSVTPNAYDSNANGKGVIRDSSGNVSFNNIFGSLTGAASLNVLKAGDEMTGQLKIFHNDGLGISETGGTNPRLVIKSSSSVATFQQNDNTAALVFRTDSGNEKVRMRPDSEGGYTEVVGMLVSSGNPTFASNAGSQRGSTSGTIMLAGYYTGSDYLATIGTQHSSGAMVLGYATAAKAGQLGFVSTAGNFNASRTAVVIRSGGEVEFFGGGATTTAVGADVTMERRMYLDSNGHLAVGGTGSPQGVFDVLKTRSSGDIGSVLIRQPEGNTTGTGTGLFTRAYGTQYGAYNGRTCKLSWDFYGNINSSMTFYRGGGVTGGSIAWSTNNDTERMWLATNGVLAVGNVVSYPTSGTQLISYNTSYGYVQVNTSDSSRGLAVNSTASSSQRYLYFRDNGGTVCEMTDANGSNTQGGMTLTVFRRDTAAGLRLDSRNVVGNGANSGGEGTMTFYARTYNNSNFDTSTNPNNTTHAAFKFFSLRNDGTQTPLTISSFGYIGTKGYTSPVAALCIAGANNGDTGSGKFVHNTEQKIEISGYAGFFGASRTVARFKIGQCNAHCEVEARVAHDGGGMHGGWRRITFAYNCYTATVTTADDNVNWGGGQGWSISRPADGNNGYGNTSTLLDVSWGGATAFNCCGTWYIRVTNHFATGVYLIDNYGF